MINRRAIVVCVVCVCTIIICTCRRIRRRVSGKGVRLRLGLLGAFSKSNKTEEKLKRKPQQRQRRRRPRRTASGRARTYYDPARMWVVGRQNERCEKRNFFFAIQWTTRRALVRWSWIRVCRHTHIYINTYFLCSVERYFVFFNHSLAVQARPENMKLKIVVWIIHFASSVSALPDTIRIGKRRAYHKMYYATLYQGLFPIIIRVNQFNVLHSLIQKTSTFLKLFRLHNFKPRQNKIYKL